MALESFIIRFVFSISINLTWFDLPCLTQFFHKLIFSQIKYRFKQHDLSCSQIKRKKGNKRHHKIMRCINITQTGQIKLRKTISLQNKLQPIIKQE